MQNSNGNMSFGWTNAYIFFALMFLAVLRSLYWPRNHASHWRDMP